jgi:hypothetical protein
MRAKISLRAITALQPNSIIWDTEIRGLNVRRQFSEVVTYSIVYDGGASGGMECGPPS